MHIIPVIDLMHGQVVQAVKGQRQHYRPIQSQLTDSHALIDVVAAILQVYPFNCLYIADLNAITGDHLQANHQKQIAEAMQTFPTLQWWVDAGIRHVDALQSWRSLGITPILASESQADLASYQQLKSQAQNSILSLDFFMDGYHGPRAILDDAQHWTQPTLIMSLPKVGAHQGPDLERIRAIKHLHPHQRIYAAGGVRNHADILALADAGAEGVLVATALHQRQIEWPRD